MENTSRGRERLEHAADARWCSGCGAELAYATVFYGHLGHWRCPQCGRSRPAAGMVARRVGLRTGGSGIGPAAMERGLASFRAGFGRQERLVVGGRRVQVILAKNPAGLNEVLRTITADGTKKNVAVFLNDDIADGRDVSWIWDVDFDLLAGRVRNLTVSGTRAWDMALRLKYAGLDSLPGVEEDTAAALRRAIRATPEGGD